MGNKVELQHPIAWFDLETTGPNKDTDRIVEIFIKRLEPGGKPQCYHNVLDPQMPISPQATVVHGYSNDDVEGRPTFAEEADAIYELVHDADIGGYNVIQFDWPLISNEFARIDGKYPLDLYTDRKIIDPFVIFERFFNRRLECCYKHYTGKKLVGAHGAMSDVNGAIEAFEAMYEYHEEIPRTIPEIHAWCNEPFGNKVDPSGKFEWNDDGDAIFTFGKHRGMTLQDVAKTNPGYFNYMLDGSFAEKTKEIAQKALQGSFPKRK